MKKIIFCALLWSAATCQAESVATVLSASPHATKNGAKQELSRSQSLQKGDSITTDRNGSISFKYNDGTLVSLGQSSHYKIINAATSSASGEIQAELTQGKLYSKTTGSKKESLKTPVMALAILGTQYHVYVSNPKAVHVYVGNGRVQAGKQIFTSGQSFLITPDGIMVAPFPAEGLVDTTTIDATLEESADDTSNNGELSVEFVDSMLDVGEELAAEESVQNDLAALDLISCT